LVREFSYSGEVMELYLDPELLEILFFEVRKEPEELFFDDQPLDCILYGKPVGSSTNANLFLPTLRDVRRIDKAVNGGNIPEAIKIASALSRSGVRFSKKVCSELAIIMYNIIPNYPKPKIEYDLSPLCPLLEEMWRFALKLSDRKLQKEVGISLYRCYEHTQQYREARRVLSRLIRVYREDNNSLQEAIMINNFAFEYLLEGKWEKAEPLFKKAARIFRENHDELDYANAMANYWTCRIERGEFGDIKNTRKEIKKLVKILSDSSEWHRRKPLILRAKIEEYLGNIERAIRFVERAIRLNEGGETTFPELDRKYLEYLRCSKRREISDGHNNFKIDSNRR